MFPKVLTKSWFYLGLGLGNLVSFYQRYLSILLPSGRCLFEPSCSEYTKQAFIKHGPLVGLALGAWRLLRCHPYGRGGYEPVPEKLKLPRF